MKRVHVNPQLVPLAVCAALVAGAALAQGYPKEGPYDYVACYAGTVKQIELSKTHRAFTSDYAGTIRSNIPNTPFDNMSFRCIALTTSFSGKGGAHSVCETTDKDGDKYLVSISTDAEGNATRENVAGTGKFDGFTAKGTGKALGPFPPSQPGTVQNCTHQQGTYKFKSSGAS
ncbi:MAG: hypothetical protein NVS2B4_05560 [Ramlibacter sp.]